MARLGKVPYNFQSRHLVRILDLMLLQGTLSIFKSQSKALLYHSL